MVVALASALLATTACGDDSSPAPPEGSTTLRIVSGDAQVGLAGVPLPDSLVVELRGEDGPLAGAVVTWTALGPGALDAESSRTDGAGRAMVLWRPGPGPDSVRVSVGDAAVVLRARGETAAADTRHLGRNGYVEYRGGTLPVVISAPHGGTLEPSEIPDRTSGTLVRDRGTDTLAFAVADALEARTGRRPHLIVSHLHRLKLDPNREIGEAAQGRPRAEHAWHEFQSLIEHARARVIAEHGAGFYIDLHGHGHPIQRLELGYLLTGGDLARSDAELDQGPWATDNSIRRLVADAGVPFSTLLRGPQALGSLLEEEGVPATPGDVQPDPGGEPFFSGGYNTARHGSLDGSGVSGVQIEVHYVGARDTPASRAAFAAALARALERYLARWY